MNKFTKFFYWLASAILSCVFLILFGVVIAAFDEFARVPFYFTLPLVALVVNASAALWVWQRNGRPRVLEPFIQRVTILCKRAATAAAVSGTHSVKATSHQTGDHSSPSDLPSWSDIAEAVHSVAWWLPPDHSTEAHSDERGGRRR
jgi:hypothetical protein